MASPIRVGPTENKPTHHLKLTDSSATEIGLVCTNRAGKVVPQISVTPYPTMASQIRTGRVKYADKVPPFEDIAIQGLSGGLGHLHHDEDSSGYWDSYGIDAFNPERIKNAGFPTYTRGIRDLQVPPAAEKPSYLNRTWGWEIFGDGTTESAVVSFDCVAVDGASYNVGGVWLYIKAVGTGVNTTTYLLA